MTPSLYIGAALLALNLILGAGWYTEHAAHKVTKTEHRLQQAKAAQDFAEQARAKEREWAGKYAAAERKHQQELTDAAEKGERVAADLRRGQLRLRDEWAGCETDRLSQTAAAAARADDLARLREQGASDLVRLAAECDA